MQISYQDLRNYVNTVFQLEKEKMVLENTYAEMVGKRNSLGQYGDIPNPPEMLRLEENPNAGMGEIVCFGISITALMVLFINITLNGGSLNGVNFGAYLMIFIIFASVGIYLLISRYIRGRNLENDIQMDYYYRYEQYNELLVEDVKRRDRENAMIPLMEEDINIIVDEYYKTVEMLKEYYSLNIIYPSYQGDFVAISMFAQYLNMEMCYSLTGHEGCYTLYEQQKMQGTIVTRLNDVISQLNQMNDQLSNFQYTLVSAVSETNEKIEKLTAYVKRQGDIQQQHYAVLEHQMNNMRNEITYHNNYVMLRDLIYS